MSTQAEAAVAVFTNDYNCSQAVFSAFAEQFGLDPKLALRLASPFGGGLARRGEVCGAVSGALLALGLARGTDTPRSKEEIYRLSQELMRAFEAKHGSLLCRELIGCDMSTPEGHQAAAEKGVFRSICPGLVRHAAELVETLVKTA